MLFYYRHLIMFDRFIYEISDCNLPIFCNKKIMVQPYWLGWWWHPTPVRYPTTAYRGDSWLLVFTPGPVHPSLANLNALDSSMAPILTASLVRTFRQHEVIHHTEPPASGHSTIRPRRSTITEDANLPVETHRINSRYKVHKHAHTV